MRSAITFYFNEIFPTYEDWKEAIKTTNIVNFEDVLESDFDKFVYNLLFKHFNHCNVRYDVPSAFISELLVIYENKFKQFLKEKTVIDAIFKMSVEELAEIQTSLNNIANNPNEEPDDPKKPLKFISAQTYNLINNGRYKAYLEALESMPTLNIYRFFKGSKEEMGFEDLFMSVQPIQKYLYNKEQ